MLSLVTLITDFGSSHGCVGIMKGVMTCINPDIRFIDIAHHIPAHDVLHAAFVLKTAYKYFPEGTVHLTVVDPGVGGSRRPIAVQTEKYYFVGPDNGVFTYIYAENEFETREIREAKYTLGGVSTTFDGRDVFSPVASYLSLGVCVEEFGPRVDDPVTLNTSRPEYGKREIRGHIIHTDQFGNLITDIEMDKFAELMDLEDVMVKIGDLTIKEISKAYSDGSSGEPVCLWGSHGYLEVAVNRGRAVDTIEEVGRGSEIIIESRK